MMARQCRNSRDTFCYICGEYTLKPQRRTMTALVRKSYELYFGCKIGDQDKEWAPHICCVTCAVDLRAWLRGTRKSMPFAVPMIRREQKDHVTDCYFCLTNVSGFSSKNKKSIEYPNLPSAIRPVPHDDSLPVPKPPEKWSLDEADEDPAMESSSDNDPDFEPSTSGVPHLITQSELNDLVRDLALSKAKAELLGSRLQGWHLLSPGTKISVFRSRQADLVQFFAQEENLCFCTEVDGLLTALGYEHDPQEWRLFIDSSLLSLKAVLLHNGNIYPSIPVGYAAHMKETYENMELLLKQIQYSKYNWNICGDLKVVALLLGMQLGYTKYCCFICEWDSRAREQHYVKQKWPLRKNLVPGQKNVAHQPLVEPSKIFLPPLHIKLGLMKNFVKAMNKEGAGFRYLRQMFPRISDAKIKEGIFVGPQIRHVMNDEHFEEMLVGPEKVAWRAFKDVVENFLGNHRALNYRQLVNKLLSAYKAMKCNMSLKIHFLHSHLDFFPANLGAVSDEQGERFHQDISTMEKRYQGNWNPSMLADYCWTLQRDASDVEYKRKSTAKHF